MNKNAKTNLTKFLIALTALAPVAKNANAKAASDYKVSYYDNYTFTIKAGPLFVLPSRVINSQIKATDLEGFNGGAYLEAGFAKWAGGAGASGNGEVHLEFTGRFEYTRMNSRAQSMIAADNAHLLATGNHTALNADDFGCAQVTDLMGTLNGALGFGGNGVTFDTKVGLGWHLDNHGNYGPVFITGCGLGVRLNKQMKLLTRYNFHVFPFENLRSHTMPATSVGIRHSIEIGFMYKIKTKDTMVNYSHRYNRGKHR